MLLLFLFFYLRSVGNLSPWKAFNIHHPQECTNHQITGCSAEALSVLPLGAGHCIWTNQYLLCQRAYKKKKKEKRSMTVQALSHHIPQKGPDSGSSLRFGQCFTCFKHVIACISEQSRINSLVCNCPQVQPSEMPGFCLSGGRLFTFNITPALYILRVLLHAPHEWYRDRAALPCPRFLFIAFWPKREYFSYFCVISWP